MTDERIAEIAAGLSEAQRRAVKEAYLSAVGNRCVRALVKGDPRYPTLEALHKKGVLSSPIVTKVGFLTPLGLAVRNHLQERGDG